MLARLAPASNSRSMSVSNHASPPSMSRSERTRVDVQHRTSNVMAARASSHHAQNLNKLRLQSSLLSLRNRERFSCLLTPPHLFSIPDVRVGLPHMFFVTPAASAISWRPLRSIPLRFFHQAVSKAVDEIPDLSSEAGLDWLKKMQDEKKFDFRMKQFCIHQLKEDDMLVGFRVRRPEKKYAGTDVFYIIDSNLLDPKNEKIWLELCNEFFVSTQITRQSSIDLFTVTKAHRVWANPILTKYGLVTQVLVDVDFAAHEYVMKEKLTVQETDRFLHAHPERFTVRNSSNQLVPPTFNSAFIPK